MNLLRPIASMLVLTEAGANTVFKSDSGFKITYPTRCKIDHSETTSVKFYVYLAENTPVNAVTVSTDDGFDEYATLDTVTERYADSITSAYQGLKVLSKERTTLSRHAAFRAIYRGSIPVQYDENTAREETLKVNQTWTLRNARVYTLTYKAFAKDYNRYLPQARSIMNSFTLE